MILVIAGTQDGRELACALLEAGYPVTASVVSQYGRELLDRYGGAGLKVNDKPLDQQGLVDYIAINEVELLVDASHPYAANASENAMAACHQAGIPYIRFERAKTGSDAQADNDNNLIQVADYAEAAARAASIGRNIFITTGSRNLAKLVQTPELQDCQLTVRVLPTAEVIAQCQNMGLNPGQIIALQGPFSTALNRELYLKYKAEVVITKDSGKTGGTDTKLEAAKELGLPVVVIQRPKVNYDNMASSFDGVLDFVRAELQG